MPAQTPLNINPYFDDFDENKNYYRTMFKPGYPLQARELTQSQTILQDQIEKLASRFMKDGDNIVPGEFSISTTENYVRVSEITQGTKAVDYIGFKLTGTSSGVIATVTHAEEKTDTDDTTFFVVYETSGNTSEHSTFVEGEVLECNNPSRFTATVGVSEISEPIDSTPMGFGTIFKVEAGSYYVNGFMVRNDEQLVVVDKYSESPDAEVGFVVTESLITSAQDPSLLDNAQGSSNFAAPGADRLQILLTLKSRPYNSNADPNFILLAKIAGGNMIGKPDQSVKWAWLYDILAKRTNDESGDYIVKDFPIQMLEYANSEIGDGMFDPDSNGEYPATPENDDQTPINVEEADELYAVKVDEGLAYVQGYEIGFNQSVVVFGDKPRTVSFHKDHMFKVTPGYNFAVTNAHSFPDIQNISASMETKAMPPVIAYRNYNDGYVGQTTGNMGAQPQTTYHIICDTTIGTITGSVSAVYQEGNSAVVISATELGRGDSVDGGTSRIRVAIKVNPTPTGVIYPRYFIPDDSINDEDGIITNDSVHRMGAATAKFFTEIALFPDTATAGDAWNVGDRIFGEESGAVAIVEDAQSEEVIVVSNKVGEFFPGETIFQPHKQGQVARSGEVYSIHFLDGPDSLSSINNIIVSALGSTISLNSGTHYTNNGKTIILNKAGRDRLYNFPFVQSGKDSIIHNYTCQGRNGNNVVANGYAFVPNFKISNTLLKTKSFFSNLNPSENLTFSADISTRNFSDTDIFTVADNALFRGDAGNNYLDCESFTGDASEQLVTGDVITFADDNGDEVRKIVLFASKPFTFSGKRSKCRIYFTTALADDVTSKVVERIRTNSGGFAEDTLLYDLPQNVIASLETDPINTRISYKVFREFIIDVSAGQTLIEIDTLKSNEVFLNDIDRITLSIGSMPTNPLDVGKFISIDPVGFLLEDGARKAVLPFENYTLTHDATMKVLMPVNVTNASSKRKLLIKDEKITIPQAQAEKYDIISLGLCDVFTINSIKMNGEDVTDNYEFDDGQRDNAYELSRLIRTSGGKPSHDLEIDLDYFEHNNDGDFFSVNSYTANNLLDYSAIPVYAPTAAQGTKRVFTYLRDVIDFRPIVNTLGSDASVLEAVEDGVTAQVSTNFADASIGGNAHVPRSPIPGTFFQCDIQYYLPKIDSLFLDRSGALTLISGEPSHKPKPPGDISSGIRLYDLFLPAYTFNTTEINTKKYTYKRFRMKDIAVIEKRVDRVEELVTLSILEQTAINFNVRDAVTGLDRFKNGIVVDPFEDHSRGDTALNQYRNSIDKDSSTLRAPHFTDQIELEELLTTDKLRTGQGYVNNEGIVTCLYDQEEFVFNPYATRAVNLQPYTVFTYHGEVKLFPQIDTWKEVKRQPNLIIRDNSLFDAVRDMSDEMADSGIGTVWNDWNTIARTSATNTTVENRVLRSGTASESSSTRRSIMRRNSSRDIRMPNATRRIRTNMRAASTISNSVRTRRDVVTTERIARTTTTTRTTQRRTQTTSRLHVDTARIQNTSYGDRVTDVSIINTMRSRPVMFSATNLKPNTKYYVFFDGTDVTKWCSPDRKRVIAGDSRFYGKPGSTNTGFGLDLVSDDLGVLNGVFIIPHGRAPVTTSRYRSMRTMQYKKSGTTRSFATGTRSFKITSSPTNATLSEELEGVAETTFTASGVIQDKQKTIVSTRIPEFSSTSDITGSETRDLTDVSTNVSSSTNTIIVEQTQINNDTETIIDNENEEVVTIDPIIVRPAPRPRPRPRPIVRPRPRPAPPRVRRPRPPRRRRRPRPNRRDPIAQTFMIDKDIYQEGVFITEIDAFFESKDEKQGVELYLLTTEGKVPTETIVPRSRITKHSNSVLRVVCTLDASRNTTSLPEGATVVGATSGATGIIAKTVDFDSASTNPTTNVNNTVYLVTLSNYRGEFIAGEVIRRSDARTGRADLSRFNTIGDEIDIERADIKTLGSGYGAVVDPGDNTIIVGYSADNVEVVFSNPQLPGGVAATGTVKVDKEGRLYDFDLTSKGSGYTRAPSISITDNGGHSTKGSGASFKVISSKGLKGVEMGVCTSEDASAATTFKFKNPIYLLGGETYAFVLKAPHSLKYKAYTSKLGENMLGTQTRVVEQPSLGALFKSQDGGLWTEDQTQDIKFNMRRAAFLENTQATVDLVNVPLLVEPLGDDPIETNAVRGTGDLFGNNPNVVTIYHSNHGHAPGDLVELEGVEGIIGGIPADDFNGTHTVRECNFHKYTILVDTPASTSIRGGGEFVQGSYSRPFEVMNIYTGAMAFVGSSLIAETTAAMGEAMTGFGKELAYEFSEPVEIEFNQNYYYNMPHQAANYLNEARYQDFQHLQENRSFNTTIVMMTDNEYVSPVLDLERTNATLTRNLIDSPQPTDGIFGPITTSITFNDDFDASTVSETLTFDGGAIEGVVDNIYPIIKKVQVRTDKGLTNQNILDGSMNDLGVMSVVPRSGETYVPETKSNGSVYAKWISRLFVFEDECDGLELRLSAIFYDIEDIKVYFRPRNVGFDGEIASVNWIPFNPEQEVVNVDQDGTTTRQIIPGLPDEVNRVKSVTSDTVDPDLIDPNMWQSLTYSVQDIAKFDGISIKIVMTAENPAYAPLIDDFMLVTSE